MAALRVLLMAVVTAMSLLGPVAAGERAAARANCHKTVAITDISSDVGANWANEARLFYCQVASSILPACTDLVREAGSPQIFSLFAGLAASRDVQPGDRPPREATLQATLS